MRAGGLGLVFLAPLCFKRCGYRPIHRARDQIRAAKSNTGRNLDERGQAIALLHAASEYDPGVNTYANSGTATYADSRRGQDHSRANISIPDADRSDSCL